MDLTEQRKKQEKEQAAIAALGIAGAFVSGLGHNGVMGWFCLLIWWASSLAYLVWRQRDGSDGFWARYTSGWPLAQAFTLGFPIYHIMAVRTLVRRGVLREAIDWVRALWLLFLDWIAHLRLADPTLYVLQLKRKATEKNLHKVEGRLRSWQKLAGRDDHRAAARVIRYQEEAADYKHDLEAIHTAIHELEVSLIHHLDPTIASDDLNQASAKRAIELAHQRLTAEKEAVQDLEQEIHPGGGAP